MHEPIDPREAEVLIQKYVSGELTPEEAARLLAHLKVRPSLGATLLGQMEIHLLLRELNGALGRDRQPTWSASSVPAPAGPLTELPFPTALPTSRRHSWSSTALWAAGLAAALALVAGYWAWPDKDNLPRLRRSSAGVEVQRGEERLPATRKLHLQPGDIVETGLGQSAVVEFAREGTRLELGGETRLGLLDLQRGKHFALHRGKLEAVVARQPAGQPLAVATPQAEASVKGTRFGLSSQWDATWLKVLKGEVELHSKSADLWQPVVAGQFAVAARDVELRARPIGRTGLRVPVPVDPRVVSTGGDGNWEVDGDSVRQSKVSVLPDPKPLGPRDQNPFSWFSRQVPVAGSIELSLQARLDAVVEDPGPLGNSHFGLTLILDRKHLNFMCERNLVGEGVAKLYSFVIEGSPRLEGGETDRRVSLPLSFQIGQTFQFKIRLTRLSEGQVQLQARVWPRGKPEPAVWQLDAIRNAPATQPLLELSTRRCACT
ncbi:MAG: FecR domain-containing protein, partial [Limisphaerales bacterium]